MKPFCPRILMVIHTRWSRNLGAPRVQLELGEEFAKPGGIDGLEGGEIGGEERDGGVAEGGELGDDGPAAIWTSVWDKRFQSSGKSLALGAAWGAGVGWRSPEWTTPAVLGSMT